MKQLRRWHLAVIGGIAAVAVLGTAAGVLAQEPVPGAGASPTFLERVAQKLGIDTGTLRDAVTSSANDEIDERVQSGDLTQEQADALKERVASAPDDAFGLGGRGLHVKGRFGFFGGEELATFLGVTAEDLRTELQADGATLASVATAHGKSRDELKAFLTAEFQSHLAEHVANGDLTQEEADARLADKTANLDAMIDGTSPFHRFHRGPGFDRMPATEPDTGTSTAPVS